jgi:hypothetical protein
MSDNPTPFYTRPKKIKVTKHEHDKKKKKKEKEKMDEKVM